MLKDKIQMKHVFGRVSESELGAGRLRNPETPCGYIIALDNESIYFFYHSKNITKKFIHEYTIF